MMLIGIHGPARSGKDTAANYLKEHQGFIRVGFADPLKRAAQQMFMLSDDQTWSDAQKEVVIPYWGMSPRTMFQKLGTEGGRDLFGKDLWLKRWRIFYEANKHVMNIVVSDVRFDNEAEMIRGLGGFIIHLSADRAQVGMIGDTKKHASEQPIAFDLETDIRIPNNGTITEFQENLWHAIAWMEDVARART